MNWQETKLQLEKCGVKNLPDMWQYRIDLSGADLRWADLSGAYLSGAYLRGADLRGAYLRGADLRGADLRGADLRWADLRGADLRGADLRWADLRGAYLSSADLRGADLPVYQKWYVTWKTDGTIRIGCEEKTIAEWDKWFASDETFETERNTADFERIQVAYEHAKRMYEIWLKHEAKND